MIPNATKPLANANKTTATKVTTLLRPSGCFRTHLHAIPKWFHFVAGAGFAGAASASA